MMTAMNFIKNCENKPPTTQKAPKNALKAPALQLIEEQCPKGFWKSKCHECGQERPSTHQPCWSEPPDLAKYCFIVYLALEEYTKPNLSQANYHSHHKSPIYIFHFSEVLSGDNMYYFFFFF
jgi:hypothetical protein